MSIVFSGRELVEIAIGIERRGIMFYDIMAKSTDNEVARAVFESLAEMEREHIVIFEDMRGKAGADLLDKGQEYFEYLQSLTDEAVFTDDAITSEMAAQADSDIKALELAISAEKDSILFYYEIRDIVHQQAAPVVNRIIAEEKYHLKQLAGIKKKLALAE